MHKVQVRSKPLTVYLGSGVASVKERSGAAGQVPISPVSTNASTEVPPQQKGVGEMWMSRNLVDLPVVPSIPKTARPGAIAENQKEEWGAQEAWTQIATLV